MQGVAGRRLPWVEESSSTQRTPYRFTGKELDEETQLYYFGARYYDPRTSVWQSADPILSDYLNGTVNEGIYRSINVNLYRYAALNPLRLIDPTGMSEEQSDCPECDEVLRTRQTLVGKTRAVAEGASNAGDAIETAYSLTAGGGAGAAARGVAGGVRGLLQWAKGFLGKRGVAQATDDVAEGAWRLSGANKAMVDPAS